MAEGAVPMSNVGDEEDARFFMKHPDRNAHIRSPRMSLEVDKQRAMSYVGEMEREFRTLGPHKKDRRRIILWRIPQDNPFYDPKKPGILKFSFLAFTDETIEDTDAILLPILHQIMEDARKNPA